MLQRKYIRLTSDNLAVDLHKKFAIWVEQMDLSAPTEEQWKSILDEDGRCGNSPFI